MDSARRLPIDRHGHDVGFDRADRRQEVTAPRRRWSPADKAAVIRESLTPGADLVLVPVRIRSFLPVFSYVDWAG
jgi:hypothetical protein